MSLNISRLKKAEMVYMANHKCKHRHSYLDHTACYIKDNPSMEKLAYYDIEATDLVANFGVMLSWCIKPAGKSKILFDVITKRDLDNTKDGDEDRRIVESCVKALSQFDIIVTHYGSDWRYDMPFIRTRAVAMDIPFLAYGTIKQVDTFPILKSKFRLRSNRQEAAVRCLVGKTEKNHIDEKVWRRAGRGDKKALNYVLDHNKRDVRDLERLYQKIEPYSSGRKVKA